MEEIRKKLETSHFRIVSTKVKKDGQLVSRVSVVDREKTVHLFFEAFDDLAREIKLPIPFENRLWIRDQVRNGEIPSQIIYYKKEPIGFIEIEEPAGENRAVVSMVGITKRFRGNGLLWKEIRPVLLRLADKRGKELHLEMMSPKTRRIFELIRDQFSQAKGKPGAKTNVYAGRKMDISFSFSNYDTFGVRINRTGIFRKRL